MEKKQNVVKVILLWCLLGIIPVFPLFFDTTLEDDFPKCRCTLSQQNVGSTTLLQNPILDFLGVVAVYNCLPDSCRLALGILGCHGTQGAC